MDRRELTRELFGKEMKSYKDKAERVFERKVTSVEVAYRILSLAFLSSSIQHFLYDLSS